MLLWPFPGESDEPITETNSVELSPGQRGVITFTPTRSTTQFQLGAVGISKLSDSSYRVDVDKNTVFGADSIPPTDIDDMGVVWQPTIPMKRELRVVVEDLRGSGNARDYFVQPLGYEEPQE